MLYLIYRPPEPVVHTIFTMPLRLVCYRPICKSKGKKLRFGNKKDIINSNLLPGNPAPGPLGAE